MSLGCYLPPNFSGPTNAVFESMALSIGSRVPRNDSGMK